MQNRALFLGIDIGTSRAKGALYDERGAMIAQQTVSYASVTASADAIEQDAEEWWQSAAQIIRSLADQAPAGSVIRSLSFSTQGGSLVATDASGQPLDRAIIWQDQRGKDWRHIVLDKTGAEAVYEKTGWSLGNGLNLLQIMRLRATRPGLFQRAHYYLSVADFLSLRLTGIAALDYSNGGINQLINIHEGKWDETLLELAGIKADQLAELIPSGQVIGRLLPDIAAALNLPPDIVLVSGGHDQYCAALGAGAVNDRDRLIGTGTAWVLVEIARGLATTRAVQTAVSRHVVPGLWGRLISLPGGGASLEWFLKALPDWGTSAKTDLSLADLDRQVQQRLLNKSGPYFFPFLSGSSYPRHVPKAQATFTHLAIGHDWIDMAAAIMEGVAMQVAWTWDGFPESPVQAPVIMTGGASHSQVWRQLLANVMGSPLTMPEEKEVGCLGAAMLAAGGPGDYTDAIEACRHMSARKIVIEPDQQSIRMQERFSQYKATYAGLFQES